jgi:Fe2+ transport system protein FeoA/Mn-dependent DtxR family transcriptional regulator
MRNLGSWFWAGLSIALAILWVVTLLRWRSQPVNQPPKAEDVLQRIEAEDMLKIAYTAQVERGHLTAKQLAEELGLSKTKAEQALEALVGVGWAKGSSDGYWHLTQEGQQRAQELIRAHRLWERYLVDREGMALEAVHAEADLREHATTPEELDRLDTELGYPAWDPHGHAIPAPSSELPSSQARSLLEEGTPGRPLRIMALDDEPAALLAQLTVMGLRPGIDVEVVQREPPLLRLRLAQGVIPLADAAARHVAVVPLATLPVPLGELPVGARARVVEIGGSGRHQRRMLDMGFVPGAEIAVIRKAPLGDPVEYRVKDTAVALRKEDAGTIAVEELRDDDQ